MIQVLETVFVSVLNWEARPLSLQVKVDEPCRARLCHCLVVSVHCAHVEVKVVVVPEFLVTTLSSGSTDFERAIPFLNPIDIVLVLLRKELLVVPDSVEHL